MEGQLARGHTAHRSHFQWVCMHLARAYSFTALTSIKVLISIVASDGLSSDKNRHW